MDEVGVDEFGREHFVVEVASGRLGLTLTENEKGFVLVQGFDAFADAYAEATEEADRRRLQLMRDVIQIGDRIVAIEGQDVVHDTLKNVISKLGKLNGMKRRLTFARYRDTCFDTKHYDVEKLVLTRFAKGPLGLKINERIPYGVFVDGILEDPDGLPKKTAHDHRIHCGCQIVYVNGVDVSGFSRTDVVALLAALKDQEKEIVFYRTTDDSCTSLFTVELSASARHLGFTVDDTESVKCVIASVGPRCPECIQVGDVLIGVNSVDVSWMKRKDSVDLVKDTPLPRFLVFARLSRLDPSPECHRIHIESGPLGLNLDPTSPTHARITGFTDPSGAERPHFQHCADFLPGSYIISIGHLDVSHCSLAVISGLLFKLRHSMKEIVVGNHSLLVALGRSVDQSATEVSDCLDSVLLKKNASNAVVIAGFQNVNQIKPDVNSDASFRVPVGSVLQRLNNLNVSCLTLSEVTDLMSNLICTPRTMTFFVQKKPQDTTTKTIDVRVPPGPLGIDLKVSIANKVIVDRLNRDSRMGSTHIANHGGVIEGSELLSIDGIDAADLELPEISQTLRLLIDHEKVITFSTTRRAYDDMHDPGIHSYIVSVCSTIEALEIEFDDSQLYHAIVAKASSSTTKSIPIGSKLIAVQGVNISALLLGQVRTALHDLGPGSKTFVFDTRVAEALRPSGPDHVDTQCSASSISAQVVSNPPGKELCAHECSLPSTLLQPTPPCLPHPFVSGPSSQSRQITATS